jgi:hypothetical protein
MVLIERHVSAYLEAIITFTNVGYRRLTTRLSKSPIANLCKPEDGLQVGRNILFY